MNGDEASEFSYLHATLLPWRAPTNPSMRRPLAARPLTVADLLHVRILNHVCFVPFESPLSVCPSLVVRPYPSARRPSVCLPTAVYTSVCRPPVCLSVRLTTSFGPSGPNFRSYS